MIRAVMVVSECEREVTSRIRPSSIVTIASSMTSVGVKSLDDNEYVFQVSKKAAEGSAGDSSKVGWWWSKKDAASVRTADPSLAARARDDKQIVEFTFSTSYLL